MPRNWIGLPRKRWKVTCRVANQIPLFIEGFLSFGSQAPFFHALRKRSDRLSKFIGSPVKVPKTLTGKWINLWEPLDVLAFIARKTFVLADGSEPIDRMVSHRSDIGLWTHSSYWESPELPVAIIEVFLNPADRSLEPS